MLITVWLISREVTTVIEVPLFRVDKFVKFEEFVDKLPVHIKWLDGRKNITNTYSWSLPVKFTFQLSCFFYIDEYISFLLFHYQ